MITPQQETVPYRKPASGSPTSIWVVFVRFVMIR